MKKTFTKYGSIKPFASLTAAKREDNNVVIRLSGISNCDVTLQEGLENVGDEVTRYVYTDQQLRDLLIAYETQRDDVKLADEYDWGIEPEEVIDDFLNGGDDESTATKEK